MSKKLLYYCSIGKLIILKNGPMMGAVNIKESSNEMIKYFEEADFVVLKGCRISEMMNGAINKVTFSAYNIVRQVSEITSGISADSNSSICYKLTPGEYAYWGVIGDEVVRQNKSIVTISEHFKSTYTAEELYNKFNYLKQIAPTYEGIKRPLYQEMNKFSNLLSES